MKIYLDTCVIQRPLDSKTQIRIALEAEAVLGILSLFEAGAVEIISSDALLYETNRNPTLTRQQYALEVLSKANRHISLNDDVENRARQFTQFGVKTLDALHLACAEGAEADYFCTVDTQLLKKAKTISNLKVVVLTPIELVEELES
ncbi:MAG: PIN domain-containing protein [Chloroflexi bacterium]|nr:PIN domain-containing protein [Ardenticatenaceae bacterium]MBL1131114.1 PIN domain-containing protein [Chloroflexota bacterium]NOG37211.1 PIN domain-containing protein [Chloroflexota bacterium]